MAVYPQFQRPSIGGRADDILPAGTRARLQGGPTYTCIVTPEPGGSEEPTVGEVLEELAALRLLDRKLRSSSPGSPEYQDAAGEVDRKSEELIGRLRGLSSGSVDREGSADDPGAAAEERG